MPVLPGLDVLLETPPELGPVGLLTNAAAQTTDGRPALSALRQEGVHVAALFTPEHGYYGVGAAGEAIPDGQIDGVPLYSLYGSAYAPARDALSGLSAVIIDLQDTGLRWYTYVYTLTEMLRACAAANVTALVLDRPNPLGGVVVEGPIIEPAYASIVAVPGLPIRYGLTLGEVARFINQIQEIGAAVEVVAMHGWRRDMMYADTGLAWNAPSPGMPHAHTALAYSSTCLIEGLNVSEGRGTALPFEQIGAPYIDPELLADEMTFLELPGVRFSPAYFKPLASKFAGEMCRGVRLHITDPRVVQGVAVGLHLASTIRALWTADATWLSSPTSGKPWFDALVGSPHIRAEIDEGVDIEDIVAAYASDTAEFTATAGEFYLYE
jgi:uncharacterized protein YbbC (DUF1343 family)